MNILLGTHEIAGMLPTYADGFRRLGHRVTTFVRQRHPFYPDVQYDIEGEPTAEVMASLIASHDVFVYHWGESSLFPRDRGGEYRLLRRLEKRIVFIFWGDDIRHGSAYKQQYGINLEDKGNFYKNDPLARPLRNLRLGELFADLIFSMPNQSVLAVRPYMQAIRPLDLHRYPFNVPGRDVPVLVHAPSDKGIKGSELIVAAVERLRSENVPFEFRMLHGISNRQVLAELVNADIAVDQLYLPIPGIFALEAMASGCAVASANREELDPLPPNRPIWYIDPQTIYDQLKRLLTDKPLRLRLAWEGRQYVELHHNHVHVAQQIIDLLNADGPEAYDHYPTFFARDYHLPHGEIIPDDLKRMTAQIVRRWGLPEDVDPRDMIARGLMSADGLVPANPIPRWRFAQAPVADSRPSMLNPTLLTPVHWMEQANKAVAQGDLSAAAQRLHMCIGLYPTYPDAYVALASITSSQGDYAQAQQLLQRALMLDPGRPELLNQLGCAYFADGKVVLAEHVFQQALNLAPGDIDTIVNLAEVYRTQQRYKEAARLLVDALRASPDDVRLLIALGWLSVEIDELDTAQAMFKQVLALDPSHENIRLALQMLCSQGQML